MNGGFAGLDPRAVLVTGGTGFLGGLSAAALLAHTRSRIVVAHRPQHPSPEVVESIVAVMAREWRAPTTEERARLVPLALPETAALASLATRLRDLGVEEVVHCAACLDYFDVAALEAGNVALTRALLELAQAAGVLRFVYVSTAYSCGVTTGPVAEKLHATPLRDPTPYTRTKREAEWLVAESGLPYLILRPSIVIGDSRDGHYGGKAFGLARVWRLFEQFGCTRYRPTVHLVMPPTPLPIVPQDAFWRTLLAARSALDSGAIVHVASRHEALPTLREAVHLWVEEVGLHREVHYYDRDEDVPAELRARADVEIVREDSVMAEIAAQDWHFETRALDLLRAAGHAIPNADLETVRRCQRAFVAASPRVREFVRSIEHERPARVQIFEHGPFSAARPLRTT